MNDSSLNVRFPSCPLVRLHHGTSRQVQFACLGAIEALCRGNHAINASNSQALLRVGSVPLLENTFQQFSDDAEMVTLGLHALVEMLLASSVLTSPAVASLVQQPPATIEVAATFDRACIGAGPNCNARTEGAGGQGAESLPLSPSASSSPCALEPNRGTVVSFPIAVPVAWLLHQPTSAEIVAAADISKAIGMVLAILERNHRREVCLAAFQVLLRFLLAIENNQNILSAGTRESAKLGVAAVEPLSASRDSLQRAKIVYAVKRALKLNPRDDYELSSSGGAILKILAVARGRELTMTSAATLQCRCFGQTAR